MAYAKGSAPKNAKYAKGGPSLGRTRDFMKEPVPFRDDQDFKPGERDTSPEDQQYGKGKKK